MTKKDQQELENELNKIFEDERTSGALKNIYLAFNALYKISQKQFNKLSDDEMWQLKDVFYLGFDNHYGEEIPIHGGLTVYGNRKICEDYREEILKKCEHIIKRIMHF